jgi:hypothetical protein
MWSSSSSTALGLDKLAEMSFHLRPPSVDKGVSAFFWALGFFLYLWLGMLALGISKGTALVLSAVAGSAIFLYIRLYGEDRATRA